MKIVDWENYKGFYFVSVIVILGLIGTFLLEVSDIERVSVVLALLIMFCSYIILHDLDLKFKELKNIIRNERCIT